MLNKIENISVIVKIITMNKKQSHSPKHLTNNIASDVEYELSRCFMNYARDQLINKELQVMMESNLLIQTLTERSNKRNIDSAQKQLLNFNTSKTLDTLVTEEDEQPRIKIRPFTRKTAQGPQLQTKSTIMDPNITNALDDIKENCSRKTFTAVSTLLENYNKLRNNQSDKLSHNATISSKNLLLRPRPDTDRNNSDQAIILAAKNLKLEKDNMSLTTKIKELEQKIDQINSAFKNQVKTKQNEFFGNIKSYFDNRQKKLQIYTKKVQHLHNGIIHSIQTNLVESGCNRCCVLVKKVKDSLINYKQCLHDEINTYKQLWEKLNIQHQNKK